MSNEKDTYTAHPAANAFPMMDDKRYAELLEDIKANGLRQKIILCDGMILDGRNRYKACKDAGVNPEFETYTGNPWVFAWSLNGQRRDLAAEQRYLIWKFVHEHSDEWKAEQKRIQHEANAKRAEAAKEQHEVSKPRAGEKKKVLVDEHNVQPPKPKEAKERKSKAKASKTNAGAVARGDKLAKERPDLAEKVRLGEMKPAQAHRQMKADSLAEKVEELPADKFRVIYADPPWSYNDKCDEGGIQSGGAEWHYPSMSVTEICALPIKELAQDDSVLFLWATSPLLPDALKVCDAWGFKYKAAFIWDKVKHNMGHYNSVRHELLLICTRGSCTPDKQKLFDSVQVIERTDKHSEKPEEFRQIIDTLYVHGKKIELFRRGDVPDGWQTWGNEANA